MQIGLKVPLWRAGIAIDRVQTIVAGGKNDHAGGFNWSPFDVVVGKERPLFMTRRRIDTAKTATEIGVHPLADEQPTASEQRCRSRRKHTPLAVEDPLRLAGARIDRVNSAATSKPAVMSGSNVDRIGCDAWCGDDRARLRRFEYPKQARNLST